MNGRRWVALGLVCIALVVVGLWVARAWLAAEIARAYFRQHGVASDIRVGSLGFSGVSGSFALGRAGAPDVSARRIEVRFDPLRWIPYIVEVRLVDPVVRARIGDDGHVTLGSLQPWLDSLSKSGGKSSYVSDDLAVSLTGLRALLATPAGALEVDGDLKLARNLPVSASLRARPGHLSWKGHVADVKAASLSYDAESGHLDVHIAADLSDARTRGLVADLAADRLDWRAEDGALLVAARRLNFKAKADGLDPGILLEHPSLDLALADLRLRMGSVPMLVADVAATMKTGLSLAAPDTGDAALTRAIARNLNNVTATFKGHVRGDKGHWHLAAVAPVTVQGAAGAKFVASGLVLDGPPDALTARFDAALSGGGLPRLSAGSDSLSWKMGALSGTLRLAARFDYAMLRGAAVSGQGMVSWRDGTYRFALAHCVNAHLDRFRPSKVMAQAISASLCPQPGKPLLSGGEDGWALAALVRDAKADLPLAGVHLDQGVARLDFHGGPSPNALQGSVAVSAARIRDGASPARFNPVTGSGTLRLGKGVWRGTLAVAGKDHAPLAGVGITHVMATGKGSAHIAATNLAFDPDHLQPVDLSPLLAAFRQTRGAARFDGDVTWDTNGIDSYGVLAIDGLDFLTPLGTAHDVKTRLVFTSLLPPRTAPGQDLAISRIDWTLPFTGVDLKFGFGPKAITVDSLKAGFAEGRASLGHFTVKTADPTRIQGAADLDAVTLSSLIAATNMGNRVKLEGKVSGHIPFTTGPEGIRIANGHLSSDGPGRLSIDRSLWTQGGAAGVNAVQDFAYQALENLAFDQMSAQLNSVPGGRLQVVFHIKGRSDPPKPQIAEVSLGDILNGSALRQSIPLPSGTPIDLTLDTSLNFDELLKSYAEAWSKALGPAREGPAQGAP